VRRLIIEGALRMFGVVGLTVVAYALIPIEGGIGSTAAIICASVGIVIILVVYAWQLTRVSRSLRPILAVVEAVGLVFGLFVCMFSLLYVAISTSDPSAFSELLNKAAGIYFTVTVLATVGFGDITPVTDTARLVVTLQMVIGVTLVGTAIKALSNSARSARSARSAHGGAICRT
jgi:hypothetical protein